VRMCRTEFTCDAVVNDRAATRADVTADHASSTFNESDPLVLPSPTFTTSFDNDYRSVGGLIGVHERRAFIKRDGYMHGRVHQIRYSISDHDSPSDVYSLFVLHFYLFLLSLFPRTKRIWPGETR